MELEAMVTNINMGQLVVYDREENRQLEMMMMNLGLGEEDDIEVKTWEVEEEWLIQWLDMQDRLGLDVVMVNMGTAEYMSVPEEEVVVMDKELTPFLMWRET